MIFRNAEYKDIGGVLELQKKYHISSIKEEDRADGFVTTLFTKEQLIELVVRENGLALALDGERIVGYAMAASWEFWSAWTLFQFMIQDLQNINYLNRILDTKNSYQYGPICIDRAYRGTEVLLNIFECSRFQMQKKYPVMITFINQINPRSFNAHTRKLGLDVIKTFEFNNNRYYELGYDTSKKTMGATI